MDSTTRAAPPPPQTAPCAFTASGPVLTALILGALVGSILIILFVVLGTTIWRAPASPTETLPRDVGREPRVLPAARPGEGVGPVPGVRTEFLTCVNCETTVGGMYAFRSVAPKTAAMLVVDYATELVTFIDSGTSAVSMGVFNPATGLVTLTVQPAGVVLNGSVAPGTTTQPPVFTVSSRPAVDSYDFQFGTLVGSGPWAEAAMVSTCASSELSMVDWNGFHGDNQRRCLNVRASTRHGELAFRDDSQLNTAFDVTCGVSLDTGRVAVTVFDGGPPFTHGMGVGGGAGAGGGTPTVTDRVSLMGTLQQDYTFRLTACSTPTLDGAPRALVGPAAAVLEATGFLDLQNGMVLVNYDTRSYPLFPLTGQQVAALTVWP